MCHEGFPRKPKDVFSSTADFCFPSPTSSFYFPISLPSSLYFILTCLFPFLTFLTLKVSYTSAFRGFREYVFTESIRGKWRLLQSLAFFFFSCFAKDVSCFSKGNLFHNTAVISGRFMIRLDIEKDAQSTKPIKLLDVPLKAIGTHDRHFIINIILDHSICRGNLINQFPYEVGKPCSKCASGKGFCYQNLCSKYIVVSL